MWSAESVLDMAARWQWTPYDAVTVSGEFATVVVTQARASVRWDTAPDAAALVDEAAVLAREAGATMAIFAVHDLTRPDGLAEKLVRRGALLTEELDISALELSRGLPELDPPAEIEVRRVDDPALLPEVYLVGADAFGNPYPTPEFQAEDAAQTLAQAADPARTVFRFLGKLGGMPVSAGGLTMDGQVAKLWGGAVIGGYRGRGAYRAVLTARLREAKARGATLALSKARKGTSSPILRRAGFRAYGVERQFTLAL